MVKPTDYEWNVLEVLWRGESFSLGEIRNALEETNGWNKNTVYTYLTRMEKKGLVKIDRTKGKPYSAAVTREKCAREERKELLNRVYDGAAGDMIAAFLKESKISEKERNRLRRLLDDMEV